MNPNYRLSEKDMPSAWDIWHSEFDNDPTVTGTESQFSAIAFKAHDMRVQLGRWPTYGEVLAVVAEENRIQNEKNDAKEIAFYEKHGYPANWKKEKNSVTEVESKRECSASPDASSDAGK